MDDTERLRKEIQYYTGEKSSLVQTQTDRELSKVSFGSWMMAWMEVVTVTVSHRSGDSVSTQIQSPVRLTLTLIPISRLLYDCECD